MVWTISPNFFDDKIIPVSHLRLNESWHYGCEWLIYVAYRYMQFHNGKGAL